MFYIITDVPDVAGTLVTVTIKMALLINLKFEIFVYSLPYYLRDAS